jgi:hypothetical protein
MQTRYEVEVTPLDCKLGVRANGYWCAVKTALERLIPDALFMQIYAGTIRFTLIENGIRYRLVYPTPPVVGEYILAFDKGLEPTPMAFVLDDPQITELAPKPAGIATTPTFKVSKPASSKRTVRIFGERAFAVNRSA